MKFLDREAVHRLADYPSLIDAIAAVYATGCDAVDRMILSQPTADGGQGDFIMQPAWLRGRAFGIKIANVFPGNQKRGLQASSAFTSCSTATPGNRVAVSMGLQRPT
jgi:alanine dehydrogenase